MSLVDKLVEAYESGNVESKERTFEEKVLCGEACPYCGGENIEYVRPGDYKDPIELSIFLCRPCDAYVPTVDKRVKKPAGTLADKELRMHRQKALRWFNPLVKKAQIKGRAFHEAHLSARRWVSKSLNIPLEMCKIYLMDKDQCEMLVRLCQKYYPKKVRK